MQWYMWSVLYIRLLTDSRSNNLYVNLKTYHYSTLFVTLYFLIQFLVIQYLIPLVDIINNYYRWEHLFLCRQSIIHGAIENRWMWSENCTAPMTAVENLSTLSEYCTVKWHLCLAQQSNGYYHRWENLSLCRQSIIQGDSRYQYTRICVGSKYLKGNKLNGEESVLTQQKLSHALLHDSWGH